MVDIEHSAVDSNRERVQKVLARLGYGSRRSCEEMLLAGRVEVNGSLAVLGDRMDPETDTLSIDGIQVSTQTGLVYYLLNKPSGVVVTSNDPQGRKSVLEFVPKEPRVFSVGRLDLLTEGLLILTNDGEFAHTLTHPSMGVEKEYLVHLDGVLKRSELAALRRGVDLDDGPTYPAKVRLLSPSLVKITIHEGRNRQVRRMMDAVGHRVIRLVRTRIGPITDDRLAPGEYRSLFQAELIAVRDSTKLEVAVSRAKRRARKE